MASPRDELDVHSLPLVGHDLDTAYVEHWAGEWDVLPRWGYAIERV